MTDGGHVSVYELGSITLRGIPGSPGVAVGPATVIGRTVTPFKRRHVPDFEIDNEVERFNLAVGDAEAHLRGVMDRAGRAGGELAILDAYILMLGDEVFSTEVERKIRIDRKSAEWAVASTIRELAAHFEGAEDPYLRERSHDFHFVGELLVRALRGGPDVAPLLALDQSGVVLAHELSPADTAAMIHEPLLALVTEGGTRTGHTAIMARAFDIPAVVGVTDALLHANPGDMIVVDGNRGTVVIRPTDDELARARRREQVHQSRRQQLRDLEQRPATMACGTPVTTRANIELPEEAAGAVERGALGIGLYRTEFMYINRSSPPTIDEQYETYRDLVLTVAPQPVTLRTFDIGGDKFASALSLPSEMNPALGVRAVRLGLSRPQLLFDQLTAMVRASAHGPIRIMIPMVATLTELRQVHDLLRTVLEDIDRQGIDRAAQVPLGVMMEVPSALLMADRFAIEADFMSIGTNDLVQYTLAVDRTNQSLAALASPYDPSILRLIRMTAEASERHRTPLSVCGEMASDPLGALLLVGLGLRDLSMEAASVAEIKETLRRVRCDEAERVARESLQLDTAERVEQHVARAFAARLADLLEESPDSED